MQIPAKPIIGRAKFLERKILADTVYELKFEMVEPKELEFEAGQYIALDVGNNMRRQYSISNSPSESKKVFCIVIDVKPNGVGTKYLMNLNSGDEIRFIGQIGIFVLPEELDKNLFFIATGVGLAPLKSMIDEIIAQDLHKKHNIFVHFGTRFIGDIFYEELFNDYLLSGKIHDYKIYLSQASMPGTLEGYVTQFIDLYDEDLLATESQFFICGSGAMVRSVEEELSEKNVPEVSIFYEKFYS